MPPHLQHNSVERRWDRVYDNWSTKGDSSYKQKGFDEDLSPKIWSMVVLAKQLVYGYVDLLFQVWILTMKTSFFGRNPGQKNVSEDKKMCSTMYV